MNDHEQQCGTPSSIRLQCRLLLLPLLLLSLLFYFHNVIISSLIIRVEFTALLTLYFLLNH